MKIKSFLAFAMAAATMSFMACNNDGTDKISPDDEVLSGEKTYAVLEVAVSEGGTKVVTPEAGDEAAIQNEAKIADASIYIFKYASDNSGVAEVKKDVTATQISATEYHVPATAVMLTSGKKHVIVVANVNATVKAALDGYFTIGNSTSYDEFYKAIVEFGAANPEAYTIEAVVAATGEITMSGETDPTLKAGVSATEAESEGNQNHIKVFVDRLPAKIDVALTTDARATYVDNMNVVDGAKTLGNVNNFTYDARNLNRKEYVMKNITGTFVNTPYSSKNDWKWNFPVSAAADWDKFFPIVSNDLTLDQKLMMADANNSGTDYRDYVTYMPENTNEDALKGNTSYVALKASYAPGAGFYVTGFTNDAANNNVVTLTTETFASENGKFSMFNYNYNLAFKLEATAADATKEDYIEALAAYHVAASNSLSELKDISAADIFVADATTAAGYVAANGIQDAANVTAMQDAAIAKAATGLYVYYAKTSNDAGALEQIQIVAYYVWNPSQDNTNFVINGGVDFSMLTCGVYNTDANGLVCYYRVDIFDADVLGETNMMRNSVVRNYSYHMNISKIKKIGYPTQIDLVVNPDEPINTNTFIQAHIIVNQWTAKTMGDVELDR